MAVDKRGAARVDMQSQHLAVMAHSHLAQVLCCPAGEGQGKTQPETDGCGLGAAAAAENEAEFRRSRLVGLAADIAVIDGCCQPDAFLVGHAVDREAENTPRAEVAAHILMLGPAHVGQVTGHFEKALETRTVDRNRGIIRVSAGPEQRAQQIDERLRNAGEPVRRARNFLTDHLQKIRPVAGGELAVGNQPVADTSAAHRDAATATSAEQAEHDQGRCRHRLLAAKRHTGQVWRFTAEGRQQIGCFVARDTEPVQNGKRVSCLFDIG